MLTKTVFELFGEPVSWAELFGFITGIACVALAVAQRIETFPVGIANNVFFVVLFADARLYADAGLQIVYVILGCYGWWSWRYGGVDRTRLSVRRTTAGEWAILAGAGVVLTGALYLFLTSFTGSTVPLADALTTALSLLATYGQSRKLVESWWLWIAADLIYIPLYGYKELWLTAILYVAFMILSVFGLRAWTRAARP